MMTKISKDTYCDILCRFFDAHFLDAKCALNYEKDYELVIAVMLSAQAKDERVNAVDEILFRKYPDLMSLKNADINEIENIIKPLGLAKRKANNIKMIASLLLDECGGVVPHDANYLLTLPGIGNKAKNVILIELFDDEEFPVDTHVYRISYRLGLRDESDDVNKCENKLRKFFFKRSYKKLHHQMIAFGRTICKAKAPNCQNCDLRDYCRYFRNKWK